MEDLKIPVKTGAEVKEIVMNADGVVTGVKAEIDGTEETIDSIAVVAADKDLLSVLSGMEIQLTKAADEKLRALLSIHARKSWMRPESRFPESMQSEG